MTSSAIGTGPWVRGLLEGEGRPMSPTDTAHAKERRIKRATATSEVAVFPTPYSHVSQPVSALLPARPARLASWFTRPRFVDI